MIDRRVRGTLRWTGNKLNVFGSMELSLLKYDHFVHFTIIMPLGINLNRELYSTVPRGSTES